MRMFFPAALAIALGSIANAVPPPTGPVDALMSYRLIAGSNFINATRWLRPDGTYITLRASGVIMAVRFESAGDTGTYTLAPDPGNPSLTDIAFDGDTTPLVVDFATGQFVPSYSYASQFSWTTNPRRSVVANTSARAWVNSGHPAIAGLVLESSRTVVIRAIGPGLTPFGVSDALSAPKLTLYRGNTSLAENTKWSDFQTNGSGWTTPADLNQLFAMIGAFPLTAGSNDCLLIRSLPAGTYTIQVSGADANSSGTTLIETYVLP